MFIFSRKSILKYIPFYSFVAVLLALAALILINKERIKEYIVLHQERNYEREKVANLEEKIKVKQKEKDNLKMNKFDNERVARDVLNMRKSDEKIFRVEEETSPTKHLKGQTGTSHLPLKGSK